MRREANGKKNRKIDRNRDHDVLHYFKILRLVFFYSTVGTRSDTLAKPQKSAHVQQVRNLVDVCTSFRSIYIGRIVLLGISSIVVLGRESR